jgi:DNA-3-methyladenine glycosylase I
MKRCVWCGTTDELMIEYHDREWGVPVHDDSVHFECLTLEAFQAGLSWKTILHKRENFRKAFANFDYKKIALFSDHDKERLMSDAGIVRNRQKIAATIKNAQVFMDIQKEFGSFDKYVWGFVQGETISNNIRSINDYQATSPESQEMSKDMKKRGFAFCGPTICYAYMQAAGLVNDHEVDCFRHETFL